MIKLSTNESQIGGKFDRIEIRGKNITIKDVVVEGEGITLYSNYNCSGLTVEDSTFISHSNNAVKIIADNVGGVIENVVFKNCTFMFARMGVEIQNHKNTDYKIDGIRFDRCTFIADEDNGSDYKYGVSLTGYGRNAIITNCSFSNCRKGVEIVGFSNLDILNCAIYGSSFSIISSNDRQMRNIIVKDCRLCGQVRLEHCANSIIERCTVDAPYIEIKHSNNVDLNCNEIRSTSHYGVMLNQSSQCLISENTIIQTGNNYSIVRCYGKNAINNIVRGNSLSMPRPKRGKWYDQASNAQGNEFVSNKTKLI